MSGFDGNLSREAVPLQAFGVAPGAAVRYRPAGHFAWAYDIALNEYTGTDRWDRMSHALSMVMTRRPGRVRLDTKGAASWKVPSEDGELTKQVEISESVSTNLSDRTRVQLVGSYRYKYYVDHPDSSGISPFVDANVDRRFGPRHFTLGYRFQTRESRARSDSYYRHGYAAIFSTPISKSDDQLSFDVEYRPQTYRRLIESEGALVRRHDERVLASASYQRPLTTHVELLWFTGFQRRWSNDLARRYAEPTVALTVRYRWR
jgi:hypothetical protein